MAIKKLIFYLVAVSAIALGAVWMVLSPEPVAKQKAEESVKRSLAYQQAIAEPPKAPKKDAAKKDIPAFETVTTEDATAANPSAQPNPPAAPNAGMPPQDMAALPGQGAPSQDPAAVPPVPGQGESLPWATDRAEQRQDLGRQGYGRPPPPADPYAPPPGQPYGQRAPYGQQGAPGGQQGGRYGPDGSYDPYAAQRDAYARPRDPYAQPRDPYAQPQDPYAAGQADPYGPPPQGQWGGQNGEEWVQVIGSGTGMRSAASLDAPILFAFPYGRQLTVASRNGEWVEVTDPSTSATGWMLAHALAPSAGPNAGPGYGQEQAYEEEPQKRRGLFGRGAFGDMINRAFGGRN